MQTVAIEWVLPDGRGAGRAEDGRIVRVAGAVPGDVVSTDGTPVTPSVDRREPACPWDAECGGCSLSRLAPDARHRTLAASVAHAFRLDEPPRVVPSPRAEGHRARVKLAIDAGRIGYHRARSHELVEVGSCRIARPEVQAAHTEVATWLSDHPDARLDSVELRSDGERVAKVFSGRPTPGLDALGDVALGARRIAGDPTLRLSVDGLQLRAGPLAFYQVNLEVNALLVAHVRDSVLAAAPERVLDLYAGIGNLGLPIAARGVPVVAVEAPGPGSDDLRHNARAVQSVQTVAARVERFDPSEHAFDAVVLDPPRAGAPGVLPRLALQRPKVVVYVSCHAPSAARDVRALPGYRITSAHCFDLFPDTHHIETVVVLERT